jgi:hypothetical protein
MSHKAVNFDELVKQVRGAQVGKDKLSIWGGECSEAQALDLVQHWPTLAQMPYRIWEYSSDIAFGRDTLPDNAQWLERGRLFGPVGDFTLLRDGNLFRWHFVGQAGTQPPTGNYGAQDYWQIENNKGTTFHRYAEQALLWGERKEGQPRWFEDRVGAAQLEYPVPADWRRVQICYDAFSRNGRVEFVWLRGLEEWKEADNG